MEERIGELRCDELGKRRKRERQGKLYGKKRKEGKGKAIQVRIKVSDSDTRNEERKEKKAGG